MNKTINPKTVLRRSYLNLKLVLCVCYMMRLGKYSVRIQKCSEFTCTFFHKTNKTRTYTKYLKGFETISINLIIIYWGDYTNAIKSVDNVHRKLS